VAYIGQFDHLIRADERGRAVQHTRSIVVFDDGLVICPVRIYADAGRGVGSVFGALRRGGRLARGAPGRGAEQIQASAQVLGSCLAFAPTWPKAQLIPLAVVDRVVLTRPRQVSELAVCEQGGDPAAAATSTYLGDLSPEQVRGALEPLLGDRLEIRVGV
jgi:hypothetical protein